MARTFVASGSDEFLEADTAVFTAAPFTVSNWFRVNDVDNIYGLFFVGDKDVTNNRWFLNSRGSEAGDPLFYVADDSEAGTGNASTSTSILADTWHHGFAREVSTTSRNVSLDDGGEVSDTTGTTPASADRTSLARLGDSTPSVFLDGDLGPCAVWSVVLSDNERGALARGVNPFAIRSESQVALWPVEGNDSPEIDYKGTLDLTVNGTPLKAGSNPPVELLENYL